MAQFIIKFNDQLIGEIPVKQGDMLIGRQPDSDLLIDNLAVSGRHANIFTVGEDSFLQDLGSTNGTFINGRRVTKAHLHPGDVITVGKHTVTYVNDPSEISRDVAKTVVLRPAQIEAFKAAAAAEAAAAPVAPPNVVAAPPSLRPAAKKAPVADALAQIEANPAPVAPPNVVAAPPSLRPAARKATVADARAPEAQGPSGALYVLSGNNSGKRIALTKPVVSLGRAGRRAGVINRNSDGGFTLKPGDIDAAPKVNGNPVTADGHELRNGDVIEIAGSRMQFQLR